MSPEETMDSAPKNEPEEPKKRGPRKASEVIAETEERVRAEAAAELAELKAQLEAANAKAQAAEASLSEMQKVESVEDQLKAEAVTEVDPDAPDVITVNFVEDGLTALGRVWYRGEELSVKRGSREWDQLYNQRRGKSVLEFSEDEQIARWGMRMFRPGQWQGHSYEALLQNTELSDEERADIQSILNKRSSGAPAVSTASQKRSPVAYS